MSITHSTAADGTFSASGATAWNAAHTIAANTITEAMLSIANNTTGNVSTSAHGFAPILPNDSTKFLDGTGAYSTPSASVTLNGISAAAGSVTLASGNNTGIVWNWANTSNSTVAFTFGETSAATSGTSTNGIPNQVLLKLTTLAASTQSPLSVYSRGSHVFSVSPTAAQILATDGTASNVAYAFANDVGTGMTYNSGAGILQIVRQGTVKLSILNTVAITSALSLPVGTSTGPTLSDSANGNTGLYWPASNTLGIANGTTGEILRFVGGTASVGYVTHSAVAFANLPAAANGSVLYCSDCDAPTLIDSTCTSAGGKTGSMAARVNGAWKCYT